MTLLEQGSKWLGDWAINPYRLSHVVAGADMAGVLQDDEKVDTPRAQYFPECASRLGRVTIAEAGRARAIETSTEPMVRHSMPRLTRISGGAASCKSANAARSISSAARCSRSR